MLRKIIVIALVIKFTTLYTQTKTADIKFKDGCNSSRINVSILDNVIYIPISINNNPPVDFVLDTGAPEISIIESKTASKLELSTKIGGELKGAGKDKVKFQFLENVTLGIPNIEIINPRLGAVSLAHMEPFWGKPKYGLLGGNILKDLITEIDYINKRVVFHKPEEYLHEGTGERIPLQIIENAILIKAKLLLNEDGEEIEGLFLIDTAVRNTFLNSPFTKKHKLIEQSNKILKNITGYGLGGVGFGKLSRLKSLKIGNHSIVGPIVELTTDTKGVAASKQFDGIIGADILSRFNVVIDYRRSEIFLQPNVNFHSPYKYDGSGMYIILDKPGANRYKVAYVVENSPASVTGILKEDILLELDNIPVKNFNYEQIKNYLKEYGKTIRIKILRNTEEKVFTIKLRNLL